MLRSKADIITFKVDEALSSALRGIENRSEFIRNAVLAALENVCPLCKGTGVLSPKQKEHWEEFSRDHAIVECKECHEFHIQCSVDQ